MAETVTAQNPAMVRKMAFTLLKQNPVKRNIKNNRGCLAWDELLSETLLAVLCHPTAWCS